MRAEGDTAGLHGFPDSLTVTGPYVNKTLFEQAGVELPGEGTTWEEWTELTKQVAEATGVQYAISIDRTGHRFAGPAMSMGRDPDRRRRQLYRGHPGLPGLCRAADELARPGSATATSW
jgi:hypothetical protein